MSGFAMDYCVKRTVLDALRAGFVYVMTDCIKGVNVKKGDSSAALRLVAKRGARPINSVVAARRSRRAA